MAERLNAAVLKTVGRASVPGVRIPLSPPGLMQQRVPRARFLVERAGIRTRKGAELRKRRSRLPAQRTRGRQAPQRRAAQQPRIPLSPPGFVVQRVPRARFLVERAGIRTHWGRNLKKVPVPKLRQGIAGRPETVAQVDKAPPIPVVFPTCATVCTQREGSTPDGAARPSDGVAASGGATRSATQHPYAV